MTIEAIERAGRTDRSDHRTPEGVIPNGCEGSTYKFAIKEAEIVRTGADGGRAYLKGCSTYHGVTVPVTALLATKAEEAGVHGGCVVVTGTVSDYTPGAGLLLRECRLASDV